MNKYSWTIWVMVIGMGILSVMYGCCEMPEREMNEHYMQCIILDGKEAFCK